MHEYKATYVRVTRSAHDRDETVKSFGRRVLQQIKQNQSKYVIVDFRHHRGGDYTLTLPLVRDLASALPSDGHLYLITGPNTFSAGIVSGSQFKRYVPDRLTIVGQQVGDNLRFRAEGFFEKLPHSNIGVYLSTTWGDVEKGCRWFDDCFILNKLLVSGVDSMAPDIGASNTWQSYREAEDLVLKKVIVDIDKKNKDRLNK